MAIIQFLAWKQTPLRMALFFYFACLPESEKDEETQLPYGCVFVCVCEAECTLELEGSCCSSVIQLHYAWVSRDGDVMCTETAAIWFSRTQEVKEGRKGGRTTAHLGTLTRKPVVPRHVVPVLFLQPWREGRPRPDRPLRPRGDVGHRHLRKG